MIVLYDMEEVDGVALINKGVGGAALDGVLGAYVDGATGARLDARFRRADTFRRRGRGGRPRLRDVAIFRGDEVARAPSGTRSRKAAARKTRPK